MSEFSEIKYELRNNAALITLNRPAMMNAFTGTMMRELVAAFDKSDADDSVRAVVITGEGKGFCAGADLSAGDKTFVRGGSDVKAKSGVTRDGGGIVSMRMFESLKPVIVAINGAAVGVGITMILPADIRLASTKSKFGFVFARRGITPEAASSWFLPRLVGMQTAAEWVYTGRLIGPEEALEHGLVRSIHEPEDLLPAAFALVDEIAANTAPVSVAMSRQMMWRMLGASHPMYAHRMDSRGINARGKSPDAAEGVNSFLEKRAPNFPMKVSEGLPDIFPEWVDPEFS